MPLTAGAGLARPSCVSTSWQCVDSVLKLRNFELGNEYDHVVIEAYGCDAFDVAQDGMIAKLLVAGSGGGGRGANGFLEAKTGDSHHVSSQGYPILWPSHRAPWVGALEGRLNAHAPAGSLGAMDRWEPSAG